MACVADSLVENLESKGDLSLLLERVLRRRSPLLLQRVMYKKKYPRSNAALSPHRLNRTLLWWLNEMVPAIVARCLIYASLRARTNEHGNCESRRI